DATRQRRVAEDRDELPLVAEPVLPKEDVGERRDGHARDREDSRRDVDRTPAVEGAEERERDGEDRLERERGARRREARARARQEQLADGPVRLPRAPEVERHGLAEEVDVLRGERAIEPHLVLDRLDLGFGRDLARALPGGIPRDDVEQKERDE